MQTFILASFPNRTTACVPVSIAFSFSIIENWPMNQTDNADYSPKEVATFVWFEYTQLVLVLQRIQRIEQSPPSDPNEQQFQRNIHLAAFLIHARNLRAFLFPPPPPAPKPKPDDVLAKHFLPDWAEKVEDWCPYFHKHRERLNKSLAHISYKRIEYEANKLWECGTIHKELIDAWNEFLGKLTTEEQDWFTAPRK